MTIYVQTINLFKTLMSQKSIDHTKIAPSLGVNVKLVNSTEPSNYFVGTVTELIPSIRNYSTAIYSSIKIEGVDNSGTKRTLTITLDQIDADNYGNGYDKMFYTTNLHNTENPNIKEEDVDDLINRDVSIRVFDLNTVVVGNLISYKKSSEEPIINGIISAVDTKTDSIRVTSFINGRSTTTVLTLLDITAAGFDGHVLVPSFE